MLRIGVDFGGTKIEGAALDDDGVVRARRRAPNPGGYEAALAVVREVAAALEAEAGPARSVGVGAPGSPSPRTGLIRNANSVWLNGRPLARDLQAALGRPVRVANDANCMALSEATDGAGAGARCVFGVILGTGCGGALAMDGRLWEGAHAVAGEWGHTPLPWPEPEDLPAPICWCGRAGCMEAYVSGPAVAADHARAAGRRLRAEEVAEAAAGGDTAAAAAMDRLVRRLGQGLAAVVDLVDPEVIVLAGGLSNVAGLCERLPAAVAPHVFSDVWEARIVRAVHGDASGVRGAAWLWP